MAPHFLNTNSTLGDFAGTKSNDATCAENVQRNLGMCQMLFHIGVTMPIWLWPLLPSTLTEHNIDVLLKTSVGQIIVLLYWKITLWIDNGSMVPPFPTRASNLGLLLYYGAG